MSHPPTAPVGDLELVFLTAPNCRLCERGRVVLAELAAELRLSVRETDLLSGEGRRLVAAARVPFPPAVFVGGRLLAHGRLSARSLARQLTALAPNAAPGPGGRG